MSSPATKHPKRWQWRAEWLFQCGLEGILRRLPGGLVYRMGAIVGGWAWYLLPRRRTIVLRNLRIAYAGDHDGAALRRIARESFRRTGANLFSAAHSAGLSPERLKQVLSIENPELLEQAQADGSGVVLLLAHMSNWELLSRIVHLFPAGSKTGAFYRPLNNPLIDQQVLRRRQADGARMFSKHDSPHQSAGFLREGGIVGILADQRVGLFGEVTPFFGRLTRTSPLPSLLARRAKARVMALALTTTAPGRWSARFVPVAATRTTADCMVTLEQAMRPVPEDVFWFQDRWRVYLSANHDIHNWLGDRPPASVKPHRGLLWLVDAPDGWQPPPGWLHPDVRYEVVLTPGRTAPAWLPDGTVVHPAPVAATRDDLRRMLAAIDSAESLPLDFVLACHPHKALAKACRREGVVVVELPRGAVNEPGR